MRTMRTLLLLTLIALPLFADVRLPNCLSDNMVLQQQSQVKIWGWAEPGEEVIIKPQWTAMVTKIKADQEGNWTAYIITPTAGGPYNISINGKNNIVLSNIMLGEVWICSGQSNMQWEVQQTDNHDQEVASANYNNIRLLNIPRKECDSPQDNCEASWQICNPETVKRFSAVGYFFGRELSEKLDVPIGLITSAYGGTPAEAWTRTEEIINNPRLNPIYQRDQEFLTNRAKYEAEYQVIVDKWKKDRETDPSLKQPRYPDNLRYQHRSGYLFNAMIHPLLNYRIKGAIWYQGETNEPRAYQYAELFQTMINNWRNEWGYEFPFYFVQVAPYSYRKPDATTCPELQESQAKALVLPKTGMAVICDTSNFDNVHPTNKQAVGKRLSLLALAKTYGFEGITCSGPVYQNVFIEGGTATVTFEYAENGLVSDGEELRHFEMAGSDKTFYPATAIIKDNDVIVTCSEVKEPVAVRFAWHNSVKPNLFNAEGLPAGPFRTDNWECSTYNER